MSEVKSYSSGRTNGATGEAKPASSEPPARPKRRVSQAALKRHAASPNPPPRGTVTKELDKAALTEAISIVRQIGQEVSEQVDPRIVMLTLVHNTFLMTRAVEAMLRGLEDKHLEGIGKYTEIRVDGETIRVPDHLGQLAEARLRLYGEWVDRSSRVASLAVRAGLETRLVELAEQQARAIATVLQRFLRNLALDLRLDASQQELASQLMWNEVRLLGTTDVTPLPDAREVPQEARP